jgi:hypothetical protein
MKLQATIAHQRIPRSGEPEANSFRSLPIIDPRDRYSEHAHHLAELLSLSMAFSHLQTDVIEHSFHQKQVDQTAKSLVRSIRASSSAF